MADVFISYHTKSAKNIADRLCGELESRGISCWYAPRDVDPGAYKSSIAAAIRDCKVFLLILNPEADKSEQVKDEIHLARRIYDENQEAITILPIRLNHCHLSDEIYMEISRFHMIECAVPLLEKNIQELLKRVEQIAGFNHIRQNDVTKHRYEEQKTDIDMKKANAPKKEIEKNKNAAATSSEAKMTEQERIKQQRMDDINGTIGVLSIIITIIILVIVESCWKIFGKFNMFTVFIIYYIVFAIIFSVVVAILEKIAKKLGFYD